MPRKRKRQAQSPSSLEKETPRDSHDGTLCDSDEVADTNNDDDCDEDVDDDEYNSDENDESDMEMNAATYLYRVREEARNLPDIWTTVSSTTKNGEPRKTTTNTDILTSPTKTTVKSLSKEPEQIKKDTNNLTLGSIASLQYLTSHRTKLYPPPTLSHIAMAGNVWVDQILAEFSQLRLYLEQCKNVSKTTLTERQPVPPMKDFMAWFTFCIGRHHAYPRGDIDISSTTAQPSQDPSTPAWEMNLPSNSDGHTPSVSLLLQMDQVMVRRVLSHMTSYIDNISVDSRQNGCYMWIYALLARLERPIHRDDAATLFTLLKRLTLVRSQVPESALSADPLDTSSRTMFDRSTTNNVNIDVVDLSNTRQFLATLNTLIAIVGVYFEQGGNYTQIMGVPSPA
jgi:gem associated protein 2